MMLKKIVLSVLSLLLVLMLAAPSMAEPTSGGGSSDGDPCNGSGAVATCGPPPPTIAEMLSFARVLEFLRLLL